MPPVKLRRHPFLIAAALAAFVLLGTAAPAFGQEGDAPPGEPETSSTFADDRTPAVVLSEDAGAEDEAAWTFRYLVPTVLAISVMTLALVFFLYGYRVRGRYRVVR